VLLENEDFDAGASEKQPQHHAGRAAAGDAALRRRPIRLGSPSPRVHGWSAVSRGIHVGGNEHGAKLRM
jgi:hypothetical protein